MGSSRKAPGKAPPESPVPGSPGPAGHTGGVSVPSGGHQGLRLHRQVPFVVWLYRITTALAFLTAILHVTGLRLMISPGMELFSGIEVELSSLLLLLSSVSLGFCQRWVQYLSRRSRYILLPAALITVLLMRNIYFHLAENPQGVMGGWTFRW